MTIALVEGNVNSTYKWNKKCYTLLSFISRIITIYCSFLAQSVTNDLIAMYKADSMVIIGRMYEDMKIMVVLMEFLGNSVRMNIKNKLHFCLETSMRLMLIMIMIVSLTSIPLTYLSIDPQLLRRYVLKTVEIKLNVLALMWRGRLLSVMKLIVLNWYNFHLLSTISMANLVTVEPTSDEQDNGDKVPPLKWHHPTLIPSMASKVLHIKEL